MSIVSGVFTEVGRSQGVFDSYTVVKLPRESKLRVAVTTVGSQKARRPVFISIEIDFTIID